MRERTLTTFIRVVCGMSIVTAVVAITLAAQTPRLWTCVLMVVCAAVNVANAIRLAPDCFPARSRDRGTP